MMGKNTILTINRVLATAQANTGTFIRANITIWLPSPG